MLKLVVNQTEEQMIDRYQEARRAWTEFKSEVARQLTDGWKALAFLEEKSEKQLRRVRKYKLTKKQIKDILKIQELEKKKNSLNPYHTESSAEGCLYIAFSKELTMEEILRERLKEPNIFQKNLKKHRNTTMPKPTVRF